MEVATQTRSALVKVVIVDDAPRVRTRVHALLLANA